VQNASSLIGEGAGIVMGIIIVGDGIIIIVGVGEGEGEGETQRKKTLKEEEVHITLFSEEI
jgi:hypothetical protein